MKKAIKMVITHFFIITVAVLFFTTFFNTINGVKEYPISYIWQIFITGVVTALPSFILYSKKELKKRKYQLRFVFHFILIETIILAEGKIFNWYDDLVSALIIAFIVILVYAVVYAYSYYIQIADAQRVNSALQAFNSEEDEVE